MSDEKPKTVKVKALQWHTYNGKAYEIGAVYDIEEQFAESVKVQGKAVRVEDTPKEKPSEAKPFGKAAHADADDLHKSSQKSTKVDPMTWDPK